MILLNQIHGSFGNVSEARELARGAPISICARNVLQKAYIRQQAVPASNQKMDGSHQRFAKSGIIVPIKM